MLAALAVSATPVVLPATLDVSNVSFRSEGMPDFVLEEGDYAGTYFDMGAHDSSNDTLLYAEWDVTIEPIKYNIAVDVYNTNSWRVQLYLLNQAGDTLKSLRYKGSSGQCGQFAIGALDLSDLEAGNYKVRARAATAWSAMKLKDVIFAADYQGVTVDLPGTLLPAYAELSAGATIANNAIAFAPSTANSESAKWNVNFAKAGDFNVTIDITASNGHTYGVALLSADGASEIGAVAETQAWDTGVKELGAITVPAAGNYMVKLTNATQWSEAVLNSITFAGVAPEVKYYLKNNWDAASDWTWKEMTKIEDDNYQLKAVFGGTGVNVNTAASDEGSDWYPIENISAFDVNVEQTTLKAKDTVVFVYTPSEKSLAAIVVGPYVEPSGVEHTYTVAGSSAVAFGTAWDPTNTTNDMAKQDDGSYKWEKANLELPAGTIEFKVCQDHAWTTSWPAQNYALNVSEAATYTLKITFTPASGNIGAELTKTGSAEIDPTVSAKGSWDGWAAELVFVLADNKETATGALNLEPGNYEFKVILNGGDWRSNGYSYHREFTGAENITGNGDNMVLQADVAGEYTLTWTFATNALNITFPVASGIDNTNVAVKAQKMIINGQLFIIRNGQMFNAQGQLQ